MVKPLSLKSKTAFFLPHLVVGIFRYKWISNNYTKFIKLCLVRKKTRFMKIYGTKLSLIHTQTLFSKLFLLNVALLWVGEVPFTIFFWGPLSHLRDPLRSVCAHCPAPCIVIYQLNIFSYFSDTTRVI